MMISTKRTSLAEIRHHRVDRITKHRNVTLRPALQNGRTAIVQVALLDDRLRGVLQTGVNLRRPALELLGHEVPVGALGSLEGGRKTEEGIPLNTTRADIGSDEVLLGANVDLQKKGNG